MTLQLEDISIFAAGYMTTRIVSHVAKIGLLVD